VQCYLGTSAVWSVQRVQTAVKSAEVLEFSYISSYQITEDLKSFCEHCLWLVEDPGVL